MKTGRLKRVLIRLVIILLCLSILPLYILIYAKVIVPKKFLEAEHKFTEETTQYYYDHKQELNDFVKTIDTEELPKGINMEYSDSAYSFYLQNEPGGDGNILFERTDTDVIRGYGYAQGGLLYSPIDNADSLKHYPVNVIPIEGSWYIYFYHYTH